MGLDKLIEKRNELSKKRMSILKLYNEDYSLLKITGLKPHPEFKRKLNKIEKEYLKVVDEINSVNDEIDIVDSDFLNTLSFHEISNPNDIIQAVELFM